ncbi:hypothetical protein HYDPIDRAFT_78979 [Hydnomerulius pinastri MD-312]|nr:hypothetical protein HYDPIDRAFT_78979 [Hydnomerulius pinastri MD-312]
MSLVVVRVELPAYFHSFNIEVAPTATVLDVKQAISTTCSGHPQPEGQRIIWRGRCLSDGERISELWPSSDEQRIVHLSVRPPAWTGSPPGSNTASSSSVAQTPLVTESAPAVSSGQQVSPSSPPQSSVPNDTLAFVRYMHHQALSCVSNSKLAPPKRPDDLATKRATTKLALEQQGYIWPDVLDAAFPMADPSSPSGLSYDVATIDGQSYLSLLSPGGVPSPTQVHALKVLTYTFSILSMPPPPPPTPTPTVTDSSSVPPDVNDLLQQLGLPPLRAIPHANIDVTTQPGHAGVPAAPEQAEANLIREIPIRALLAPLLMVVFRTVLLLYFFSPSRKPLLGLCIVAWIMYEMWTHVRIVILRPLERAAGNGAAAAGNDARAVPGAVPAAQPAAPANGPAGAQNPLGPATPAEQTRNHQQAQGPPIPSQSNGIVDSFALTGVHSENKLLWPTQQPTRLPEPPTFLHKATMFLSLITVTLHPEIFNRRRTALRQREGRLRTETNTMAREPEAREDGEPPSEEEQKRQEFKQQLQTQHSRRATWVKQYVDRVRGGEWIDE